MMTPLLYLLGGAATFITAVVGAVAVLRKLPAEAQKINVDTVDVNVNIAGKLRDRAVADWERMGAELTELRQEFDAYRKRTEEREARTEKRLTAAEVATLKANRRADSAEQQLGDAREKVRRLVVIVNALRREMQHNNIPVPDHLADDLEENR